MAKYIRLEDNTFSVTSMMEHNVRRALTAMGAEAVHLIVDNMQNGYGKPIWQTGSLQRDVTYEVNRTADNTVDVGNTLEYAPFVHEGTSKMRGRPYLRDALEGGGDRLREVAAEYLKDGFT